MESPSEQVTANQNPTPPISDIKPSKPMKNYVDINQLISKGFRDDRLDEIIEHCIETMSFDESKREQHGPKSMIKENFGTLFQTNCSVIKAFYLYH